MKTRSITRIRIDDNGDLCLDSGTQLFSELFGQSFPGANMDRKSAPVHARVKTEKNLLREIEKVYALYRHCTLCVRNCGIDRTAGEIGWCRTGLKGRIYCAQTSFSEERIISPCYEIYFTGCNMACRGCHQKGRHDNAPRETCLSVSDVVSDIASRKQELKTVAFLGGNPDQSLLAALIIMHRLVKRGIDLPLVWNSNATWNKHISSVLNRYVDVFVPDIKYGNDRCAMAQANINRYYATVKRNITLIRSKNPVILRHCPLPGHTECCSRPIIDWISGLHNGNRYFLSLLPSFFDDNTREVGWCSLYAAERNVALID